MTKPFTEPRAAPRIRGSSIASANDEGWKSVARIAQDPRMGPNERSRPPAIMTTDTPIETMPTTEKLLRMFTQFLRVKNLSEAIPMAAQRTTNTTTIELPRKNKGILRAIPCITA